MDHLYSFLIRQLYAANGRLDEKLTEYLSNEKMLNYHGKGYDLIWYLIETW